MLYIAVLKKPRHVFTCPEYPTMPWVKMKIRIPDVFFFLLERYPQQRFFGKDSKRPIIKIIWVYPLGKSLYSLF